MTPTDLAKVAKEEEDARKSASKQWKKSKEKNAPEKPPSECPIEPSLLPQGLSAEVRAEAEDSTFALDDQLIGADIITPESETNV